MVIAKLPIADDEKSGSVIVYLDHSICFGEVIVKKAIRISTWLRTNSAPDNFCVYNARIINAQNAAARPVAFSQTYIYTHNVLGFHLAPPTFDPPDYDPTEKNRVLAPVQVDFGSYHIHGHFRIAASANVGKFLEVNREVFSSIYDAEITCPSIPSLGVIRVPNLIVRQASCTFSLT